MAGEAPVSLPDAEVRRRAATDFDTNLVVLAGAGTGKTSLLVERALNALGSGVATMESIAAITFTEKAAGEMRERLALGLDRLRTLAREGGELDDAGEADRAFRYLIEGRGVERGALAGRCLAAMERLDHGTVATIHGFCAELLRTHPVEAGVDPGFSVDAGRWASSIGLEAWEDFLRRELGPEAEGANSWERLLSTFSVSQIGDVARQLARFAVPAGLLEADRAGSVHELLRADARRIANHLAAWLERPADLTSLGEKCLRGMRNALEVVSTADPAAGRVALLADSDLVERIEGKRSIGGACAKAGAAAVEGVKRAGEEARGFCRALLRIDDDAFDRLLRVVKPFVEEYRERFLRRGLVGFDGLLSLTRDLLRNRPDVRRRWKQRLGLLLVDEFQDTDPLQYEIVLFLAEEPDDASRDPFEARLAPGRLFVVGDPKQSIYRFRGADYAAYTRAVRRILDAGGEQLPLIGNFRSVPGIVDSVNDLFEHPRGCWTESPYQHEYDPIEAVRSASGVEPAVEVWTVELPDDATAGDRREAEGWAIAEALKRWVERDGRFAYEQITLLFRAFTNLSHYLRPLRARGIPFVVDGGRDFLQRPEVVQLMATLRVIGRPADQSSLLAYLRSPAGAASDVELARYARGGGRWDWRVEPDATRFPNIASSFRTLRDLWSETREMPADRLVRRVLDRTAMLPLGALAFEGPHRAANLQKLAAAAGVLARDGTLSLDEVIVALEEGRLEEIEADRPLADDAAQAVRITNIHRMKGLENDVVVVPDLARRKWSGRDTSDPVAVPSMADGSRLLALRSGRLENSARMWHELENRRHEASEEVRVFYVALTRARERLVLVGAKSRGSSPWLDALRPWGYDAECPPADGELLADGRVQHRLRKPRPWPTPTEQEAPDAETQWVTAYEEAVAALRFASRPPLFAPSALGREHPPPPEDGRTPREPGVRQARVVGVSAGVALHRLLERWDGREPARLREALGPRCEEIAREKNADARAVEREARGILDAFLTSDLAGRLAQLERLGQEMPLLVRDEDARRTYWGSIDLLYRDAAGEVVVVDYKTDREADVDVLCRKYRPQLAVYADAVRRALGLSTHPRAELWLLRTGQVVPISTAGEGPTPRGGRG